ncbi:MAG: alpha/beta hydrolase [Hyphomicrobiaceae bacterium]|nr:alpha/beta hydrolase [Hyphomicrobiaceae bacterium]
MPVEMVEAGSERRRIAVNLTGGTEPALVYFGGYASTMDGHKARFVSQFGEALGKKVVRFDYSGCGMSGGEFRSATISQWLDDCRAVFDQYVTGNAIVVGSSMGGWLALLLNRALREAGDDRVRGLVLVAPAVDMTRQLLSNSMTDAEREALDLQGWFERPSGHSEPHVFTSDLITDGEKHLIFGQKIVTGCPVHVLQGGRDSSVPPGQAQKLMDHLLLDVAKLTLVPDGDHSLSRPEDLALLRRAIEWMIKTA